MKHLCLAILTSVLCQVAAADVVVAWDPHGFSAKTGGWPTTFAATSVGNNLISTPELSLGSGVGLAGLNNGWGGTGFNKTSLASAYTSNQYIGFSLGAAEGYQLSLSSVDMQVRLTADVMNWDSIAYAWMYSTDGGDTFTMTGAAQRIGPSYTGPYNSDGVMMPGLDLSEISGLQSLKTQVEFRLYAWDTGTGHGSFAFVIGRGAGNDLTFNGSVSAVPEPSAYAFFFLLAVLPFAIIRRRRRITG
ncbi:hypothetical protein H5P28_13380 [Ruficoccus amylovorans]|uniref:PEP-CTERM sorting domain-containing protein n=1 Tax=Ruficoccus amylovorans TaxID=1804625 RepID=A0A842HI67_9BACT|nr:hypothetical protein [Ruficoccus amylovorans]MBC2595254.1 hypothetical protein [Ruficoccus amylovorans]